MWLLRESKRNINNMTVLGGPSISTTMLYKEHNATTPPPNCSQVLGGPLGAIVGAPLGASQLCLGGSSVTTGSL